MLSDEEELFLTYWETHREKEKKWQRQLFLGLPIGLLIGWAIVFSLVSGWDIRANMVANSEMNPFVFFFAILAISCFTAFFYKRNKWEQNEQQYQELIIKKKKEMKGNAAENSLI
ncbi:MAG: hypothetical protein JSS67_10070 [Bacteroidetes bacterium]|nr:hypothetical protein [Bacteroidota bacterium]